MSHLTRQLDDLRRWMLAAVTEHGDAPHGVDELILPSRQQSAEERLAVYSRAYFAALGGPPRIVALHAVRRGR